MQQANQLILANADEFDWVDNAAAWPQLGATGAYANTTYFNPDGGSPTHPTTAGQAFYVASEQAAFNGVYPAATRTITGNATQLPADRTIVANCSSACTLSLIDANTANFNSRGKLTVQNIGTTVVTLSAVTGESVGTAQTLAVAAGTSIVILPYEANFTSAGANWVVQTGAGGGGSAVVAPPSAYASGTTYAQYQLATDPTSNITYVSMTNGNQNNSLTTSSYWIPYSAGPLTQAVAIQQAISAAQTPANITSLLPSVNIAHPSFGATGTGCNGAAVSGTAASCQAQGAINSAQGQAVGVTGHKTMPQIFFGPGVWPVHGLTANTEGVVITLDPGATLQQDGTGGIFSVTSPYNFTIQGGGTLSSGPINGPLGDGAQGTFTVTQAVANDSTNQLTISNVVGLAPVAGLRPGGPHCRPQPLRTGGQPLRWQQRRQLRWLLQPAEPRLHHQRHLPESHRHAPRLSRPGDVRGQAPLHRQRYLRRADRCLHHKLRGRSATQ